MIALRFAIVPLRNSGACFAERWGESAQLDPRTLVQNYRPIFAIEIETSEISLPGDLIETLSVLL